MGLTGLVMRAQQSFCIPAEGVARGIEDLKLALCTPGITVLLRMGAGMQWD